MPSQSDTPATATLEKNLPIFPNPSPKHTHFIAKHDTICHETSVWSVGVSWTSSIPPSILPTPRVLTEAAKWEREKAVMLCKDCSSIAKTLVCYQHWGLVTSLKYNTVWTAMKKISQIFHPQLNPVHAESAQTVFTFLLISRPLHLSSLTKLNVQTSINTLASSAQETDFSLPLMKTWMFRSWLEMLHPAATNQDFLLVISPVIQPVPVGVKGCHEMRNIDMWKSWRCISTPAAITAAHREQMN